MKFRNEEEIKNYLRKKFKREVSNKIWEYLKKHYYVEEVLNGEENALSSLSKAYKDLLEVYKEGEEEGLEKGVSVYGSRKLFPLPKEGYTPITEEDITLSKVIAYKLNQLPLIRQFRRQVLNDKLLSLDELEGWLREIAKKDGKPTCYTKKAIEKVEFEENKIKPILKEEGKYILEGPVLLAFPSKSGWTEYIPINVDGVLGRLKKVAEDLIKYHCPAWKEAEAVGFILTGKPPIIPRVRYSLSLNSPGGPCWVTLKFDARITPTKLAKDYAQIRKKILGNHHVIPLSKKHQKLAEFVSDNKGNLTWEKLMHKWNEQFPQWAYTNYRLFHRDANAAIDRILDNKIDYKTLFDMNKKQPKQPKK